MVTELITADSGKTKASPKPLKGAMKVIKKLKGRIGLGEFMLILFIPFSLYFQCGFRPGQPFVSNKLPFFPSKTKKRRKERKRKKNKKCRFIYDSVYFFLLELDKANRNYLVLKPCGSTPLPL